MKQGRGYVYDLYFHIIWCVKYRKRILKDEIKDDFISIVTKICNDNDFEIVEINTDEDHVHLLLGLSPQDLIQKHLCEGHIWSPSYYVATTSDNLKENIIKYIKSQGE